VHNQCMLRALTASTGLLGDGSPDLTVRNDPLEIIDDHAARNASIVTSLVQRHHRITLTGESLGKASPKPGVLELERDQN
jgi:hypothetical protein